jgi:Uma2 family endonuclease
MQLRPRSRIMMAATESENMSVLTKPLAFPARFQFTPEQYWDMHERGYFDGKRVELIGGEIVEMPAQGNKHLGTIDRVRRILERLFGDGYWVRAQGTLDLDPLGVPDPDIAVVVGDPDNPAEENPTTALLIVEVSDSRLAYDRTTKASLYAAAAIADYWIVNVPDRQLEVYRDPRPDADQEFGYTYASPTVLKPGATVTPLALPNGIVPVERLFFL